MQAQMAAPTNKVPTLTKQKTKEVFCDCEHKKFEGMRQMMMRGDMNAQMDQMEAMIEMMVQQAMLADEMFATHGIEEDDLNAAVMHF